MNERVENDKEEWTMGGGGGGVKSKNSVWFFSTCPHSSVKFITVNTFIELWTPWVFLQNQIWKYDYMKGGLIAWWYNHPVKLESDWNRSHFAQSLA